MWWSAAQSYQQRMLNLCFADIVPFSSDAAKVLGVSLAQDYAVERRAINL